MYRLILLSVLSLFFVSGMAVGQADSARVSFEAYIGLVKANHPLSKQADLLLETGEANLRRARGNFDPVLKSQYDQKQFDGKSYYQLNSNQLNIATGIGVEIKAGYDNNTGSYVNPESQVPDNGLAYAGIAVPLGSGLLFDERRQEVQQAKVMERATALERILMLNQLIFDASEAYWNWYYAWNTFEIFDESVKLAEFRFRGVKESFLQGDVPAIDTLEAYILVQNRTLSRADAFIKMQKAKLEASNFLWSIEQQPLELDQKAKPLEQTDLVIKDPTDEELIYSLIERVDQYHPKMQLYYAKLESLNFERRMKAEKVKPKLNVNYNFLNEPLGDNPFESYSTNDYKWGFNFSMPILLRKGRGDLQLTKIKIQQTDLDRQQEGLSLQNKIRALHTEIENLYGQIELFRDAVNNYQRMLNGEKRKFEEGESSLFIVNSRENSLISAEVKLIELLSKYQKAKAGLELALGGMESIS